MRHLANRLEQQQAGVWIGPVDATRELISRQGEDILARALAAQRELETVLARRRAVNRSNSNPGRLRLDADDGRHGSDDVGYGAVMAPGHRRARPRGGGADQIPAI